MKKIDSNKQQSQNQIDFLENLAPEPLVIFRKWNLTNATYLD